MVQVKKNVICKGCGKEIVHYCKGRCKPCYWIYWKSRPKEDKGNGISYDDNGRLKYNKEIHFNQGKEWTTDDLEYLCKFYDIDGKKIMAYALGRTETTIASMKYRLMKDGLYEKYKKSYERKLNDEWNQRKESITCNR